MVQFVILPDRLFFVMLQALLQNLQASHPGLVPVIDTVHLTKHNLTAGIDADRWFRERITACC